MLGQSDESSDWSSDEWSDDGEELNLLVRDLDAAAAGQRIAAMTEEEKNAVKMYVGCVVAVLFCSPLFFQCAPLQQPHGSGTGGADAVAQLGSVRPFPRCVLSVVFILTLHQ